MKHSDSDYELCYKLEYDLGNEDTDDSTEDSTEDSTYDFTEDSHTRKGNWKRDSVNCNKIIKRCIMEDMIKSVAFVDKKMVEESAFSRKKCKDVKSKLTRHDGIRDSIYNLDLLSLYRR
jgi:hypothetical protein